MVDGYIKLWRCSLDSQVFLNEGLWKVWTWCLLKATYSEQYFSMSTGRGLTEVYIKSGQFVFGRNESAKELRMKPSTIHKRMQKLKNLGNLNIQSNSHYSIVTICNWERYQGNGNNKEQAKEQARNRQGTGKEHIQESIESKEGKEIKEKYSVEFEQFWKEYPKKVSKGGAYKSFLKATKKTTVAEMVSAIEKQKEWRASARSGEFRPEWKDPTTWLNNNCWEDEVESKENKPQWKSDFDKTNWG